jgi:hypothetical protein
MPLCHWPRSCYPNYALGQVDDALDRDEAVQEEVRNVAELW